jgi:hypothetical protein
MKHGFSLMFMALVYLKKVVYLGWFSNIDIPDGPD